MSTAKDEKLIWDTLYSAIGNPYGTAGLMGNLYAESGLRADNLQNTGNKRLGVTDEEYTAAVDDGSYKNFVNDGIGYGLAQWTYHTRKQKLLAYAQKHGTSIGNLAMQLVFLINEIKTYSAVWKALTTATSVGEASNIVLAKYERPANQSTIVKNKRTKYGQGYYDKYAGTTVQEGVQDNIQDDVQSTAQGATPSTVQDETPSTALAASVVTITCKAGGSVNIRKGHSTAYDPVTTARNGDQFPYVAEADNGWLAVDLGPQVGWVSPMYAKRSGA